MEIINLTLREEIFTAVSEEFIHRQKEDKTIPHYKVCLEIEDILQGEDV